MTGPETPSPSDVCEVWPFSAPYDPREGGWFPPDSEPPDLPDDLQRGVSQRVQLLRVMASEQGVILDEHPVRGLARVVALRCTVSDPDLRQSDVKFYIGGFATPEILAEVAVANADASLRAELETHLLAIRATPGAAGLVDRMRRVLPTVLQNPTHADGGAGSPVGQLLDDPPEGLDAYTLPRPWLYREGAVWDLESIPMTKLCAGLVVVSGVGRSSDGVPLLELSWRHTPGGPWKCRTVERADIGSPARVAALCGAGVPIAQDPRRMVRFLADLEAHNRSILPVRRVVDGMGWVDLDDGRHAFVWGREVLGAAPGEVEVQPPPGVGPVLDGWRQKGDRGEWETAARDVLARFPVVGVVYLASLAAPLLEVLGLTPFIVDLSGETSTGKSTALMLGASVWGTPDKDEGVFQTFGGTETALERLAAAVGSLPLLLDETKLAGGRGAREVGRILYTLASGQGRQRGRPDGLRVQSKWRAPVVLTGEAPIVSSSNDAGIRARVLTFTDQPMGEKSDAGATYAEHLEGVLHRHHGHAGPVLLARLLDTDREDTRRHYDVIRRSLGEGLGGGVAGRLARCGAVLLLAGELARSLGLPCPCLVEVEQLLRRVAIEGGRDSDRPFAALVELLSWVGSVPNRVDGQNQDPERLPTAGFVASERSDGRVAVVAGAGRQYLDGLAFDVPACVRSWGNRGWIDRQGDRPTATVSFTGGGRVRCWVFTREAIALALDGPPDAPTTVDNPWGAP